MLRILLSIFSLCVALAAPASLSAAERSTVATPDQLMSAFSAICLSNVGNQKAQVSAAEGSDLGLKEQDPISGQRRFRSDVFALGLRDSDESCAVTAELDNTATLLDLAGAFRKAAGAGDPQPLEEANSVYWLIETQPDNQRRSISLKVSTESGANLVTFMITKL
jgi:hypothetical protein